MDELLSYRYATKEYVQARIAEAMNVAGGGAPAVLGQKTITANGIYNAASDSLDGYDQVTVNVPGIDLTASEGACVVEDSGATLHLYGTRARNWVIFNAYTKLVIDDSVKVLDGVANTPGTSLTTVEGGNGVDEITVNTFREANSVTSLNFPKLTKITGAGGQQFRTCTSLTSITMGSVGYGLATVQPTQYIFYQCTQAGLTITFYTTGANVDTFLSRFRDGATNATIIVKASEATTYNGTSYAAGSTILTSTP